MKSFRKWIEGKLPEINCKCNCKPCVESDCKNCDCKNCKCKGCGCKKAGKDKDSLFTRVNVEKII